MAQYIPKTAWRVNNLVKRYGAGYVGLHTPSSSPAAPNPFASTSQPIKYMLASEGFNSRHYDASTMAQKVRDASGEGTHGRVSFIDVRDPSERRFAPLPFAVALHHHDLLSGACKPLLPTDRRAEIFVVATTRQRAVNGYNALVRWGYQNVVVADTDSLAKHVGEVQQNTANAAQ